MLNKQLQDQIEQEAESNTRDFKDNNDYQAGKIDGYKEGYEIAGEIYAEKWQQAQQLVERYEKALKNFANQLNEVCGQDGIITAGIHFIIDDMLMFPLTPKTGSDE